MSWGCWTASSIFDFWLSYSTSRCLLVCLYVELVECVQGTRGVTMFYLQVRDDDGNLNNIEVQRLKDKLGTRAVPTAELLLDGSQALQVNQHCYL